MANIDTPSRPLRVFLCHSSADKSAVRELYRRLQADGFEPWLDEEDLLPGQDWQREIPKAVRNSDVVIVCLSRGSVNKAGYIQKEIKFALDVADEQPEDTIFIIPLKLEECKVPDRLNRWQWVNYFAENGYRRLLRALRTRAGSLEAGTPISYAKEPPVESRTTVQSSSEETNQSGGIDVDADQVIVGQDVVGRDKMVSAGGHVIHAETGATVIINEQPANDIIANKEQGKLSRRDWIRGGPIALLLVVGLIAIASGIISRNNAASVSATQTAIAVTALPTSTLPPIITETVMPAPSPSTGEMVVTQSPTPKKGTPPAKATDCETYTVQGGDTMFSIGRKFNINPYAIPAANNIPYPYILYAGQQITIPCDSNATPTPLPTPTQTSMPASTSSVPTSGQCAWTEILFGTWKSINNDLVTFEPDGTGLNYHRGDRNNVTPFEWTCLENGIFKSLTGGSEYRLVFPDNDSYIMNGDLWVRATLK